MGSGGKVKAPSASRVTAASMRTAQEMIDRYYQPIDVESAYAESFGALPGEMGGLLDMIRAEGDKSAMRYRGLLTEAADAVAPVAQKVQSMATKQWEGALSGIDPNWRDRLGKTAASTDALAALAEKYLTGQEASDLITTGIVQTKRAQEISGDWLSGKLAASDQKALDLRTAEATNQFGQWGRAGASMASGTGVATNLISQQNLMRMGILASGQAGGAVSGAFGTLAGINQIGSAAVDQQQALAAKYAGPQVDVLGLYGQTLGNLAQYQTMSGATIGQLSSNLFGSAIQTGISETSSNQAQFMSLFSGGVNLGADTTGMMMQAAAAKQAADAQIKAAWIGMAGSVIGGAAGGAGAAMA